jgi:hypothetical protein
MIIVNAVFSSFVKARGKLFGSVLVVLASQPHPLNPPLQPIITQAFYQDPGWRGVRGEVRASTKCKQNRFLN